MSINSFFLSICPTKIRDFLFLLFLCFILFLNSFLLFTLEPLQAKALLPFFGGVPAVWTGCMVFYQVFLLLGYLYAHYISKLSLIKQFLIHVCLLLLTSLGFLSLSFPQNILFSSNLNEHPLGLLILVMILSTGPMFFTLSATSPMLQNWYFRSSAVKNRNPYFLYVAGNVGSLLAIILYPLIIESTLRIEEQRDFVSIGYVILNVCIFFVAVFLTLQKRIRGGCVDVLLHVSEKSDIKISKNSSERLLVKTSIKLENRSIGNVIRLRLCWVAFAFIPSSLMLGATSYLTNDIAPIPYFWALPLLLYILSFIIVFTHWTSSADKMIVNVLPVSMLALIIAFLGPTWLEMSSQLFYFFLVALACHGRLYLLKPDPKELTEFYFLISLGGALGGFFNSLVAPQIFNQFLEYPIVMIIGLLMCLPLVNVLQRRHRAKIISLTALISFLLASYLIYGLAFIHGYAKIFLFIKKITRFSFGLNNKIYIFIIFLVIGLIFLVLVYNLIKRPFKTFGYFSGFILACFFTFLFHKGNFYNTLYQQRSFFGVLSVIKNNSSFHSLRHGAILHGEQKMSSPTERLEALSYYHKQGPFGDIWANVEGRIENANIAVVGLGVGTVAAYGKSKNSITFYELNPYVEVLARDKNMFTYVDDCITRGCDLKIVIGDGRLQLKKSKQTYDLIALDAFSSDSIPTHLLTVDAIREYMLKLNEKGIVAFHITNRYVNLEPVILNIANELGLYSLVRSDKEDKSVAKRDSVWVVLTTQKTNLDGRLKENKRWRPLRAQANVGLWTDDYANLFSVIQFF